MHAPSPAHRVIAIDGPAASGKSSVARRLAQRLGYLYINTGAMYRALTWLVVESGVEPTDAAAVEALLTGGRLVFGVSEGENTVGVRDEAGAAAPRLLDDAALSHPSVAAAVSAIASISRVRQVLVARQREYRQEGNLVMEGRDIGSVVFPQTPFKYYIDASPEVRALRRARQGHVDNLAARDARDSSRSDSPLTLPEGAVRIDTSELGLDAVVGQVAADYARRCSHEP